MHSLAQLVTKEMQSSHCDQHQITHCSHGIVEIKFSTFQECPHRNSQSRLLLKKYSLELI